MIMNENLNTSATFIAVPHCVDILIFMVNKVRVILFRSETNFAPKNYFSSTLSPLENSVESCIIKYQQMRKMSRTRDRTRLFSFDQWRRSAH